MSVPTAVESLIRGAPLSAHLATSVDDRPHVAPVWYGYRDGVLYVLTGGKKLANVRRNPRVAVGIERAREGDVAWTVTLLGEATVSDDPDRMAWAEGWIYDAYDAADDEATDGGATETDGGADDAPATDGDAVDDTGTAGDAVDDTGTAGDAVDDTGTAGDAVDGGAAETDDADGTADGGESALIEIEVGSTAWSVYD